MKKELLAFSVLSAAFALVAGEYVSPNVVGRCDITKSADLAKVIVPVPFLDYNAVPASATAIKVGEIIQVGNLTAGDKLYKIDGGSYQVWELNSDKSAWVKPNSVNLGAGSGTGEVTVNRGDGFWLETAATTVTLMGQVPSSEDPVQVSLAKGMNLVGVSNLAGKALSAIAGEKGDKIFFADGSRIERGASVWGKRGDDSFDPSTYTLQAGTGFWYYSVSAKKITL